MKIIYFIAIILVLNSCTSVDSLIKDNELNKAVEYCDKKEEEKSVCYEKVADSYFKKGDFLNAEKYYGYEYSNNERKRKKSSFQIAEHFLEKKDYDNALKYYDKTNRRNEGYLKIADEYLKNKNLSKAYRLYQILDYKEGIKQIADTYYKNGEYLRAFKLYNKLNLKMKYAFEIANKLLKLNDYTDAANLYKLVNNMHKYRETYKKYGYFLLKKDKFYDLLNSDSPIISVLKTDDYLFAINRKGEIYQSYLYRDEFRKVFSLNFQKEKVLTAKYTNHSNQIILLTNAGLVFYDVVNKKINRRLNKKITAFAITKEENFVITANENIISVRDIDSLDELLFFKKHTKRVTRILIVKNKVISAGMDKLIRVWDIETAKQLFVLRGHFLPVTYLSLDNSQNLLVSGSNDKTVKLWDLKQRKEINSFKFKNKVVSVVFTNDSLRLIIALKNRIYKIADILENKITDSALFHSSSINALLVDKNDSFIYSGDKNGKLFVSLLNKDISVKNAFTKADLGKNDYYKIAEIYFNKQEYENAARYYSLSNRKDEGLLKIGDSYYKNENYDEALKYYMLLKDEKYIKKIADTYFKLGDYNKSSEYYFKAKEYSGVLKSAEMFLYEDNYYDAIKLYLLLVKEYDKDTETDKINAIYLKIANIFINMKETRYLGTEDDEFNKKIDAKLKKWYEIRFDIAQEYYDKAGMSEEGYLKLGNYLCKNEKFNEGITFYEKMSDSESSGKLIKSCQKSGAVYYFEKMVESYKKLSKLASEDGDWDLITENFNNSVKFAKESKVFFKKLRNYKKLRQIQKIERRLKRYKKSLGL